MMRTIPRLFTCIGFAALTVAVSGCSISEQSPPAISGPSELSLVLTASVTAEQIQRDGASASTIAVQVRTAAGQPVANQRVAVNVTGPTGTAVSATELLTDAAGQATVSVTAPPSTSLGNLITASLIPIDANGNPTQVGRSVSIGLTPTNTALPVAAFTFSPTSPGLNEPITFNASTSTDEGAVCGAACTYTWDFGDGNTGTGMIVTKSYTTTGAKTVRLTVTDAAGTGGTSTQIVTVGAGTTTPVVVFSPTNPRVGDTVFFDGRSSTVSGGATITEYTWDFGNGQSATGATASTTYSQARAFAVRLTIRDSLGRTGTTTSTVTVATP
jgi:PKD repeat protein